MYTFGQLHIGDLFNTKAARWVKTTSSSAVCVMYGIRRVGQQCPFKMSDEVIVLWSSNSEINRHVADCAPVSEADAFKQSLIDERDALIVRRECVSRHMNNRSVRGTEFYWLSEQYNVMYNYIAALNARIHLLDNPAT